MNFIEELRARGLIQAVSDEAGLASALGAGPVTGYIGFDPTAASLHVGTLFQITLLVRLQRAGHRPIALVGGGTGLIGDPSGKSSERSMLTNEKLVENLAGVRGQLGKYLDFNDSPTGAVMVDNAEWLGSIGLLTFLRDIGKHFSVNAMVQRDSVKKRLEEREHGISYTEFSYMLLQAYDFYHLADKFGCQLQIGGSDQWGNITAGSDLIRRKLSRQAYGLTLPLITKADGTKFGKTESGTIWLDAKRTSVYQFYQFWINTDDRDAVRYLKYFTLLPQEQITELEVSHTANPGQRAAHKALAREMTTLLHGEAACRAAEQATAILFGGSVEDITAETLGILRSEVPNGSTTKDLLITGLPIVEALVATNLSASKGQARKDIEGGGVYINGVRVTEITRPVTTADLLHGEGALLRKGKRAYAVLSAS